MPPAWAMAIAMRASVTVSMAEAMIGMFSGIARVTLGADIDIGRKHIRRAGLQQHIVEGQGFADSLHGGHRQLLGLRPRGRGLMGG